jgi:hypothetical protein
MTLESDQVLSDLRSAISEGSPFYVNPHAGMEGRGDLEAHLLAAAIVAPRTGDERQRVLWMQNARITGSLDLSGVTVPYPRHCIARSRPQP